MVLPYRHQPQSLLLLLLLTPHKLRQDLLRSLQKLLLLQQQLLHKVHHYNSVHGSIWVTLQV